MSKTVKSRLGTVTVIAMAAFPSAASARFPLGESPAPQAQRAAQVIQQPSPTAQAGFQWGDAGIGAAGAVALVGAAGLAVGATRRRASVS
jgi:hypothetical protein